MDNEKDFSDCESKSFKPGSGSGSHQTRMGDAWDELESSSIAHEDNADAPDERPMRSEQMARIVDTGLTHFFETLLTLRCGCHGCDINCMIKRAKGSLSLSGDTAGENELYVVRANPCSIVRFPGHYVRLKEIEDVLNGDVSLTQ